MIWQHLFRRIVRAHLNTRTNTNRIRLSWSHTTDNWDSPHIVDPPELAGHILGSRIIANALIDKR